MAASTRRKAKGVRIVVMDFRIGSSGTSAMEGIPGAQPDLGAINLQSVDVRPADNQIQTGRPRTRVERPREMRPQPELRIVDRTAPQRTGVSGGIRNAYGSSQSSWPFTPRISFQLSCGTKTSITIGRDLWNESSRSDGGQLRPNIENRVSSDTSFGFTPVSDTPSVAQTNAETANAANAANTNSDGKSQTSTAANTQTANPTPTNAELSAMDMTAVDAMFNAQDTSQTTALVSSWSTDGQPITKAKLTSVNSALAEAVFEKYPGDSIDVSTLTAYVMSRKSQAQSTTNPQTGNGTNESSTPQPTVVAPTAASSNNSSGTPKPATTQPTSTTTTTTPAATSQPDTKNSTTATPNTPTATATENNSAETTISDATKAKYSEMETKVDQLLAQLSPKGATAPKTHPKRCELASRIAKTLTGAKKEAFLNAMEALGEPFGLNFSLSRTTSAGKVALNANKSIGKEEAEVRRLLAGGSTTSATQPTTGSGSGSGTTGDASVTGDSKTATVNPAPTAAELNTMTTEQVVATVQAQTDAQTTDMIKSLSTDGGTNVKKSDLSKVLQEMIFKGTSVDSVGVAELTAAVIKQKSASNASGTTGTTTTGTAVSDTAFHDLNVTQAMAAIKTETVAETNTRVMSWSTDKTNLTKKELTARNPALAAAYKPFADGTAD